MITPVKKSAPLWHAACVLGPAEGNPLLFWQPEIERNLTMRVIYDITLLGSAVLVACWTLLQGIQ